MNRDDIIKLAREAGLIRTGDGWTEPYRWGMAEIERFAALVAAAERKPLTDEEIWQIVTDCTIGSDLHADKLARAIEAAHGIKGEA